MTKRNKYDIINKLSRGLRNQSKEIAKSRRKKIDGNKEKSSEVTERIKDVMGEPDKEKDEA